jgi:hypothetical protein
MNNEKLLQSDRSHGKHDQIVAYPKRHNVSGGNVQ